MSLLSVTVKKARYITTLPAAQFNTYVTLKLQNVKSTTVTVKGPTPCWEQDFLFEINDVNLGLLVEVWNKGVIWDRALGYHLLPLSTVLYNEECGGRWIELEAQLIMRGGAVVGTNGPTGHALLLDCRFEPPFDAEGIGGADLQRKLDLLNGTIGAERAEQARRQMQYITHSRYSEDSDYTSDLNFPVGQHPNCSASQFRNVAYQLPTPQRSLEVSRENSYERDEYHLHGDTDTLYYNSQPRNNRIENWAKYEPELQAQTSVESAISWRTATDWQSQEDQRRPSLERQTTLYDDMGYSYDYSSTKLRDQKKITHQQSYDEYYDSNSYAYQTSHVGEDNRKWGSSGHYFYDDGPGFTPTEYDSSASKRRSSVIQLPQIPTRQLPSTSIYSDGGNDMPYKPRPRRTAASLPATPSSTPKRIRRLPVPPGASSLTSKSGRGRRLPQPPYPPPSLINFNTQPHVPYTIEPDPIMMDMSHDSYRYNQDYDDRIKDYPENNYSSLEDEPFFNETPHETPSIPGVPVRKLPWIEPEPAPYSYSPAFDNEVKPTRTLPTVNKVLPQPPIMSHYDPIQNDMHYEPLIDDNYQQQPNQMDMQSTSMYQPPRETQPLYQPPQATQPLYQPPQATQPLYQPPQATQPLYQPPQETQPLYQPPHLKQKSIQNQQPLQNHQQKQQTPQLQTSVMTGAATLGSLMAGGAKKLGNFLGAAAAAVAPPVPPGGIPRSASTMTPFTSAAAPDTSYSIEPPTDYITSVPQAPSGVSVSAVTTTAGVTLPRTPSLRRQESIQRPPVRRTRTLPEAPEDVNPPGFDESAYEDEYHKTESNDTLENDRTSLNRYSEDDFVTETLTELDDTRHFPEESSVSGIQKSVSPTRNGAQLRKPSVDSFHVSPVAGDRKTSQGSFHQGSLHEEPIVPTTQGEVITEKSKATIPDNRTSFQEVPGEEGTYNEEETAFKDRQDSYQDEEESYPDQEEQFPEENEKFDDQEQLEPEEDNVFQEQKEKFKETQPKLTPKQRWHRAYNKIVMQLNKCSGTSIINGALRQSYTPTRQMHPTKKSSLSQAETSRK